MDISNDDKLFYLIWNNKFLNRKIFDFVSNDVKPSSLLLPNYKRHSKKLYQNNDGQHNSKFNIQTAINFNGLDYCGDDNNELKRLENQRNNRNSKNLNEIKYYKYNQIKKVVKMAKNFKELLKYKVSRNEILIFDKSELVLFQHIKSDDQDNYQFYINLFKNYSNYFTSTEISLNQTINSIIVCDCVVALKALLSILPPTDDDNSTTNISKYLEISDYKKSILLGSTNISKYLESTFSFKLKEDDIIEIFIILLFYSSNSDKLSNNLEMCEPNTDSDSEVDDDDEEMEDEFSSDDEDEEEEMEEEEELPLTSIEYYKKLSNEIYSNGNQPCCCVNDMIKEFGFKFTVKDSFRECRKVKSFLYLSSIGIVVPSAAKIYETNNELPKITSVINFNVEGKTLQFIQDVCYCLSYLEPLLKESFKFDEIFFTYLVKKEKGEGGSVSGNNEKEIFEKYFLSKLKLDEIKLKFSNQEQLSKTLEFLQDCKEIREIVLMSILFSTICGNPDWHDDQIFLKENLYFYGHKFENIFNRRVSTTTNLTAGIYKFVSTLITYDNVRSLKPHFFRFIKGEFDKQQLFTQSFINDIIKPVSTSDENLIYKKFDHQLSDQEKFTNKTSIFYLLSNFGDIKLLKMVIEQLESNSNGIEFLNSNDHKRNDIFSTIPTIEIFDLFYNNQYLRNHFDFGSMLKHCQINSTTTFLYINNQENNTISILNHFKSNYQNDYLSFAVNNLTIEPNHLKNDFIFNNFNDFKIKLSQINFWSIYFSNRNIFSQESLPLWIFIKIMEITPGGGRENVKYSVLNNPEILAWVNKFRNQDFKNGICEPVKPETLFDYYYYTNQLSKALMVDSYTEYCDKEITKQKLENLILNRILTFKLVKKVILNFQSGDDNKQDDLKSIYNFTNNCNNFKKFKEASESLKGGLLFSIAMENGVDAMKYIDSIDSSFFSNQLIFETSLAMLEDYAVNIEILEYLFNKLDIKYQKKLIKYFYWRSPK